MTIPVMAKCRIGHFVEAQVLEAIGIDYIDESEVLTPADDVHHVNKHNFNVPFVNGCRNLGEALRRIAEGAAMIRTKGEAGTGNVVEAVRHARSVQSEIRKLAGMDEDELYVYAKEIQAPYSLVLKTKELGEAPPSLFSPPNEFLAMAHLHNLCGCRQNDARDCRALTRLRHLAGRLPVVNFAAGGVATPADAALMMQLGAHSTPPFLSLSSPPLRLYLSSSTTS